MISSLIVKGGGRVIQSEFEKIYQCYFQYVFLYLLKLCKNEHLAEELTSETFFKALKAIDKFQGESHINTWLTAIAKNTYFDYIKKNKDMINIQQVPIVKAKDGDIVKQMIKTETSLEIYEILHVLEEPYKEVFSLRVLGELSFKQIAKIWGRQKIGHVLRFIEPKEKLDCEWRKRMRISCEVIKDLLPLYVENMTSEDSATLVREHLSECIECVTYKQKLEQEIAQGMDNIDRGFLKFIQRDIKERKKNAVIFIALIIGFVMFITFAHLTQPVFLTKEQSGVAVDEAKGDKLYINFSEKVTSGKLTYQTGENGEKIVIVEAWSSVWDKVLGKTTPSLCVRGINKSEISIYYCSNMEEKNECNMMIIYGKDLYQSGGVAILPRLVLGAYFFLSIILTVILGLLWLCFRKIKRVMLFCYICFICHYHM